MATTDGDKIPDPTLWVEDAEGWDAEQHYAERRENGFSKADWINFDTYIAWVIASAVQRMKDEGHTAFNFPNEEADKWEELTNAEYDVMIKGFGQWADAEKDWEHDRAESRRVISDLDAALDIFKKRFKSLWD